MNEQDIVDGEGMFSIEKKHGRYLGTEIDEKWWRRYRRDGLLARGVGDLRLDSSGLSFRRYLTDSPIVISFADMRDVKMGTWHSGKWGGGAPVIKILWEKDGNHLSSGFQFSRDVRETETLVQHLRHHLRKAGYYEKTKISDD